MKIPPAAWALPLAAAIGAALFFTLRPTDTEPGPFRLLPDDAAVVASGAKVYAMHCASCHGVNLQGQPDWRSRRADGLLPAPPHDASGHTWHHSDETLFRITKLGVAAAIGDASYRTAMPAYANILSDQQIVAALSWIKAQWPAEIRKSNDQVNAVRQ